MNKIALNSAAAVGAVLLFALASCSDERQPMAVPQAAVAPAPAAPADPDARKLHVTITFVEGGGDIAAGTEEVQRVLVTGRRKQPLAGQQVVWSSTNGGSFDPLQGYTDAQGYASTKFRAGTVAGTEHTITATSGNAASVTATVVAAAAANVGMASGDGGTATVGSTRTIAVMVRDQYGNTVPGYAVEFSATAGGGSFSPATAVTNSQGIAASQWTLGPTAGYQYASAVADATGQTLSGSPINFWVEAIAGPLASIEITPSTTTVTGSPDQWVPFQAYPYDAYHNLINPQSVTFQWSSSNPAAVLVTDLGLATVMTEVCPNDIVVTISATSGNVTGQATLNVLHGDCI